MRGLRCSIFEKAQLAACELAFGIAIAGLRRAGAETE